MIHIINEDNRRMYHHALTEMHAQRREVFIERMGWPLSAVLGLEIDQFDAPDAIYLLELAEDGRELLQSARLLPTTRPHLLGDVYGALCDGGAPRSARIWEASRFCPAPTLAKGEPRRQALMRMIAAIMETGILFGLEQVSFVASAALTPLVRRAGWDVRVLGPIMRVERDKLSAFAAEISIEGLARVREINGVAGPITRFADVATRQAA